MGHFRTLVSALGGQLPPSRVAALRGDYERVISKACSSSMIVWTNPAAEAPAGNRFAEAITVTSFAVCKDAQSDRFISWPKLQNALFAPPPDVDLPHPGVLARLNVRKTETCATIGFEMDVTNMLLQLVLPRWMYLLLPLTKAHFENHYDNSVSSSDRRKTLCYASHLRTMPKAFSWAVNVAHEAAAALLRQYVVEAATSFRSSLKIGYSSCGQEARHRRGAYYRRCMCCRIRMQPRDHARAPTARLDYILEAQTSHQEKQVNRPRNSFAHPCDFHRLSLVFRQRHYATLGRPICIR